MNLNTYQCMLLILILECIFHPAITIREQIHGIEQG